MWQLSTENFKGSLTQIATDKFQFDSKFNGYDYQKEPTGIYVQLILKLDPWGKIRDYDEDSRSF